MTEVYTSAFWSSDCCGAPFWRVCFGGAAPLAQRLYPDRFVCQRCVAECAPVKDERP